MSKWHPMETAPKDGETQVLILHRNETVSLGCIGPDVPKGIKRMNAKALYEAHGVWPSAEWEFIGWMPIPPPNSDGAQ